MYGLWTCVGRTPRAWPLPLMTAPCACGPSTRRTAQRAYSAQQTYAAYRYAHTDTHIHTHTHVPHPEYVSSRSSLLSSIALVAVKGMTADDVCVGVCVCGCVCVCVCVRAQWNPESSHLLSLGAANCWAAVYDLRNSVAPVYTISGHQKAVSYVRHVNGSQLLTASTDNTIRRWDLPLLTNRLAQGDNSVPGGQGDSAAGAAADAAAGACCALGSRPEEPVCSLVYRGHVNERNFVGLSVSPDGYIACGSEDNSVVCYHLVSDTHTHTHTHTCTCTTPDTRAGLFCFATCNTRHLGFAVYDRYLQRFVELTLMCVCVCVCVQSLPLPALTHSFSEDPLDALQPAGMRHHRGGGGGGYTHDRDQVATSSGPPAFVSSVCWAQNRGMLLSANSLGIIRVLQLD